MFPDKNKQRARSPARKRGLFTRAGDDAGKIFAFGKPLIHARHLSFFLSRRARYTFLIKRIGVWGVLKEHGSRDV
jgi:hypothetical protein